MSTRSYIMLKDGDNVIYNYIHYDGYVLGGVGQLLASKYDDYSLAKMLCNIGDRSALEDETPYQDQDEVVHTIPFTELESFINDREGNFDIDYYYIFMDGKWQGACGDTKWKLYPVKTVYAAQFILRNGINIADIENLINNR